MGDTPLMRLPDLPLLPRSRRRAEVEFVFQPRFQLIEDWNPAERTLYAKLG